MRAPSDPSDQGGDRTPEPDQDESSNDPPAVTVAGVGTLVAFVSATFLGASLLFLIEPMVTKMLLPLLGGTAAVWNTAMVFFQAALLGGYAFAHLTLSKLGTRRQPIVQLICVAIPILVLPVAVPPGWHPPVDGPAAAWTLLALTVMVGGPFFMLSTAGPTLQRWFSATTHPRAADPYFLYAAGNVGSLLALLGYPLLVEPAMSITDQSRLWAALYALFVVATAVCAYLLRAHRTDPGAAAASAHTSTGTGEHVPVASPAITARTRLRWIYLAAIPSALMLGVTRHIGTDVASMPLLWVIPLSLYLVTFIIAFGRRPLGPVRISARVLKLLVVPLALSFYGLVGSLWLSLGLHLAVFFCAALVAHGQLASERPAPDRLTEFYLMLSIGGVVGGIATALIAPVVFTGVLEYPLAIVLALTVLPASAFATTLSAKQRAQRATNAANSGTKRIRWNGRTALSPRSFAICTAIAVLAVASVFIRSSGSQDGLTFAILVAAAAAAAAYALCRTALGYAAAIATLLVAALLVPANPTRFEERTFFGVHRVYDDKTNNNRHVLLNGTTVHGMEDYVGPNTGQPTTYYNRSGPIGQYLAQLNGNPSPRRIGLVGLGSGALAAYGRPGDRLTYYEIDSSVIDIAKNRDLFTFVSDSKATVEFRLGDGRLELAAATEARYDLLVIDAFSGDAIPVHLITNEALALYKQRITDRGVIAFHISNRYFDFAPILGRLAKEQGLVAYLQDNSSTPAEAAQGKLDSTWVVMARAPGDLGAITGDLRWQKLASDDNAPLWTDAYTDLLRVFRWFG